MKVLYINKSFKYECTIASRKYLSHEIHRIGLCLTSVGMQRNKIFHEFSPLTLSVGRMKQSQSLSSNTMLTDEL